MAFVAPRAFSAVAVFSRLALLEKAAFSDKLAYFSAFKKTNEITENVALETMFPSFSSYTFSVLRRNWLLI